MLGSIFTSARGQWHYLYDRSLLARALALAERLRDIGAEESNTENSSLAFRAIGSTLMSKGEFVRYLKAASRMAAKYSLALPLRITEGSRASSLCNTRDCRSRFGAMRTPVSHQHSPLSLWPKP